MIAMELIMRNNINTASRSIRAIPQLTAQGRLTAQKNKFFHLLAGSVVLFLVSAQFSQVITTRLLQSYEAQTSFQQGPLPSQPATPSQVSAFAATKHRQLEVLSKRQEIRVGESAPTTDRGQEIRQITDTLHEIDAQTRNRLASHVESAYKISGAMAKEIVRVTISLSRKNGMDPFLALGIIASESSFNHRAKSGYGATGLMQVYAPVHRNVLEDLGVRSNNPKIVQKMLSEQIHLNVAAGIRIYKTYEKQYGSPAKALQAYNGAKWDASYSYSHKVLAVREQLRKVAAPVNSDS
jgi:soluble lytic murein transglycosylase-like protein